MKAVCNRLERDMKQQEENATARVHSLQSELLDSTKKLRKSVQEIESANSRIDLLDNTTKESAFTLNRFMYDDKSIHFYTGFPSYSRLMCLYDYLNPGDNGENIVHCHKQDKSREKKNTDDKKNTDEHAYSTQKKGVTGRPRNLCARDELFLVLCFLRQGFFQNHLAHLFHISQSSVSRIITTWVNFIYLKLGQLCLWAPRTVIDQTMPASFKEKYPHTRVIIDCTEVFCEMPSSLLLHSELFSNYKSHVTLKSLVGISPSGALTFVSQLYTGSISDKEIVRRSGFAQ